jgi:hypothetical protein
MTVLYFKAQNMLPKNLLITKILIQIGVAITGTGKSLSEALIFASTNPQYDNRLFIVHENCKLRIPAEHLCTQIVVFVLF